MQKLFGKTETRRYVVGFDLRDDFSQMSYLREDSRSTDPVTFSMTPGKEDFNIPTALCRRTGTNQWTCGAEAVRQAQQGEGTLVTHLLNQARDGRLVRVEDADFDPSALLALFINRCLLMLSPEIMPEQIAVVMFTGEHINTETVQIIENVRRRLEPAAEFVCQSYADSFYDYLLLQPEGFRKKSVLLCECEEEKPLIVRRMTYNTRTTPIVAYQEEKEYAPFGSTDPAARDAEFTKILEEHCNQKAVIAAGYLIGSGFRGGWMKKSLAVLCRSGRVFQGNNLFSKGAAIGAMQRIVPLGIFEKYFFLSEDKLKCNVGIRALSHGEEIYHPLVDAGMLWHDVHTASDLILENENELRLVLTPLTGEKPDSFLIRLENLPKREGRCTRIRLSFDMTGPRRLHLLIEDLGFGEIFPSSGYKWEQNITLRQ